MKTISPDQATASTTTRHVIFIDTGLPDYQLLIESLPEGTEVVLVAPDQDSIQVMADWAAAHTGYAAIHVFGHGSDGVQHLGNATLSSDTLTSYQNELSQIGNALTEGGDILLYGCNVAATQTGVEFVGTLAQITDADIAASDDLTGAASLGGDWVLEVSTGTSVSAQETESYTHTLAATWSNVTGGENIASSLSSTASYNMAGDFDSDGDIDFVVASSSSAYTYIRNDGGAMTTIAQTDAANPFLGLVPYNGNPSDGFVEDFDGDGDVDVISGTSYFRNDNGVFVATSGAENIASSLSSTASYNMAGDFDSDGDIDFVVASSLSEYTYVRNDGGTMTTIAQADAANPFLGLVPYNGNPSEGFVEDFDGDGDVDVISGTSYFRNDNGVFVATSGAENIASSLSSTTSYNMAGDFDSDGDIDFVVASSLSEYTYVRNDGGTMTTIARTDAANPFLGLVPYNSNPAEGIVEDFDGDGDVDVISGTSFFRQEVAPPKLTSSSPSDNSSDFSGSNDIILTFNETISTTGTGAIRIYNSGDTLIETISANDTSKVSILGSTVTVNPSSTLTDNTDYYIQIEKRAFFDVDGMTFMGIADKTTLNFRTGTSADTTAPTFDVTPSISNVSATTLELTTDIDEAGEIYFVVVADGSQEPTAAEVKSGKASGGAEAITSGSQAASSGDFSHTFNITGLTASTDYDIYIVAEDDEGTPNIQSSVTKVDVTTAVPPNSAPTITTPYSLENITSFDLGGSHTIHITTESATAISGVVELSNSIEDVRSQLATSSGLGADNIRLVFNGLTLQNGRTLSEYNIQSGSEVKAYVIKPAEDITIYEDIESNIDLSGWSFSDSDGDNLTVTLTASAGTFAATSAGNVTVGGSGTGTMTLDGSVVDINTYLLTASNIQYTGAADVNGDNAATITVSATDGRGGRLTNDPVVNLDITAVDDAPTVTAVPDESVVLSVGQTIDLAASSVADVDSASVTAVISVDSGTLTATSAASNHSGGAAVVQTNSQTVTLTGSPAQVDAYLNDTDELSFTSAASTADVTLTVSINDGVNTAVTDTATISVLDVARPTASHYTDSTNEDTAVTAFSNTELPTTEDADTGTAHTVEYITIDTSTVTGGMLSLTGTPAGGTSTTGGITFDTTTGDLSGTVNIAIGDIGNLVFTPTAELSGTGAGNFDWTVTDSGGDTSDSATWTLDITAVEDAPTLTGITPLITAREDTATNLITGTPVFADVDTTTDVQVTLTATDTNAVLTASDTNGVVVSNSGSSAITLTGTADEINTFLATPSNITYTGSTHNTTADTVTVSVADGEGGTDATATVITVNFTPVNDAPEVSATATGGDAINGAATDLFNGTAIDVDTPDTGDLVKSVTFMVSGLKDGADETIHLDGMSIALTNGTTGTTTGGGSLGYSVAVAAGTAGKAYWEEVMQNGLTLDQVAEGFVHSIELGSQLMTQEEWNFIV